MGQSDKPMKTGYTRVFLIDGRARPDHETEYMYQMKMTGVSQSYGDITKIEIPDKDNYDKFIEVDRIRGASERVTTSLVGRYASAVVSRMVKIARSGCAVDVQLHVGECTDPSDFNTFNKAIILEDVVLTNYSTEDLGSLSSDERAKIDETAEISASIMYEVVPLSFAVKGGTVVTNELLDVIIGDSPSCGSCDTESDGCKKIYAISTAAGGSPGTPPDVVYSIDGGVTWYAVDIDTIATAVPPSAIAEIGENIVVICNGEDSLSYVAKSDIVPTIDPVWTEVTTGFKGIGSPNDIWSVGRKAFIVGDWGHVYFTDDPTAGVTAIEEGVLTIATLNAVHALDENTAVAVGNNGIVMYTTTQTGWSLTTTNPSVSNNACVWMLSEKIWLVGTTAGTMYYTVNQGETWTQKTLPGTTPSSVYDIAFSTASVGYVSAVVGSKARVYRTFDGGYSWVVLPEGVASLPAADRLTAIAACKYNENMVVGVGLADDAADGIILMGQD